MILCAHYSAENSGDWDRSILWASVRGNHSIKRNQKDVKEKFKKIKRKPKRIKRKGISMGVTNYMDV